MRLHLRSISLRFPHYSSYSFTAVHVYNHYISLNKSAFYLFSINNKDMQRDHMFLEIGDNKKGCRN